MPVSTKKCARLGVSGKVFISQWKSGKNRKLDSDACPGVIEQAKPGSTVDRSSRKRES
jgi:hypothetical protein